MQPAGLKTEFATVPGWYNTPRATPTTLSNHPFKFRVYGLGATTKADKFGKPCDDRMPSNVSNPAKLYNPHANVSSRHPTSDKQKPFDEDQLLKL